MARYVANIERSYKVPIGYHFTCNYCGEANQKFYEINVSVKASGSARHLGDVRSAADRQHDRQVNKSAKETKRNIEKYRRALAEGKAATDKKLCRIPLNSECEHCGKNQVWNPGPRPGIKAGHMEPVGGVGMILAALSGLGAFFTGLFCLGGGVKPIVPAICAGVLVIGLVLCAIGSRIDDRKDAEWFKAELSGEPNDPEKLPVVDK